MIETNGSRPPPKLETKTRTLCRSDRRIAGKLTPTNLEALRQIVRTAATTGQRLYPVSRGRNYGYGSFLPVENDCTVVDLAAFDEIGELDRDGMSVRIGAGVTQRQLYDYLQVHAGDLWFNVTGAGAETSVIGNGMERGIGYAGDRTGELFAHEVVLADGSLHIPSENPDFAPWRNQSAGPCLDGLWSQSNLGIVTAARLRLRIHQERECALVMRGDFGPLLDVVREGFRARLLEMPVHLGEPGRTERLGAGLLAKLHGVEPAAEHVRAVFPERGGHAAVASLHGAARVVDASWSELRRLMRAHGVTAQRIAAHQIGGTAKWLRRLGLRRQAERLAAVQPLLALSWGVPSDIGLAALDPGGRADPNLARDGAIYLNAASAPTPEAAIRVQSIIGHHWPDVALTRIVADGHSLLTIATLHFGEVQAAEAHEAARATVNALRAAGFPPYRLGINDPMPPPGGLALRVKQCLDPARILAPGRYGL